MNSKPHQNAISRDEILSLLTDSEVAKVSRTEDEPRLIEGDEYVDLSDLAAGVQQVHGTPRIAPGHALPRSSVSDQSWAKIVDIVAR